MSATSNSLAQARQDVKQEVHIYPVQLNVRTKAAQAKRTPEERRAANEHAAKLRAQDAVLLAGPVEDGAVISIPSWRWNPELVTAIKARPGWHFEKELPYTLRITLHGNDYIPTITMPTWTVPAEPGRLTAIRTVYDRVFAREIAVARWSNSGV